MSEINFDRMREIAQGNQFRSGAKAYYDAFHCGLIPCIVLSVEKPGFGFLAAQEKTVRIVITADRPGFKRGDKVDCQPSDVIPRSMRRIRSGHYRINTLYQWIPA